MLYTIKMKDNILTIYFSNLNALIKLVINQNLKNKSVNIQEMMRERKCIEKKKKILWTM